METRITRIRVADLECTGTSPPEAAPCEVGYIDLIKIGDAWGLDERSEFSTLCNPSRTIPPEVSAIHHIIDEDVAGEPYWPEALEQLCPPEDELGAPGAFAAHNAKFERQFVTTDRTGARPRICTYKCAMRLWPDAPSHSNQALRYWHKPKGLDRARAAVSHRALPDAYVTAFLLRDMLAAAPIDQLIEWSSTPVLLRTIKFGKHAGKPFADLPYDYLEWMLRQDFDEDVMFTVKTELQRRVHGGR